MDFSIKYIEFLGRGLELAGATVIVLGAIWAIGASILSFQKKEFGRTRIYHRFRRKLGEAILLGLEFLVAADIINSVAIEPTFRSVGVLSIIIVLRTFLSFALEVEMTGKWPWQSKGEEAK